MSSWRLGLLFWTGEVLALAMVMIPVLWFLLVGWHARKDEFINRIKGTSEECYLNHFWSKSSRCGERKNFARRYNAMTGWRLFTFPILALAIVVFVFGGLVLQSAIGRCILPVADHQQAASATMSGLAGIPGNGFWPFPRVALDTVSVSAVVGAYLFAVNALIQGYRARSLVSSDVLWCGLRILISIPLAAGVSLASDSNHGMAASLVGLALGAFPIAEIFALIRRLFALSFNQKESADNTDQLIAMLGVTPATAAALNAEGISSAQQLADQDPVSIALRTGLSFDYVMNLVAQSQAWSFIGETARKLAPLGLGDARTIARLVDELDMPTPGPASARAVSTLAAAADAVKIPAPILETAFRRIRNDRYTSFLLELEC